MAWAAAALLASVYLFRWEPKASHWPGAGTVHGWPVQDCVSVATSQQPAEVDAATPRPRA